MPLISVILITYNREQYLPVMLDSLLKQTFTDFELILVNNGATDSTASICQAYAKKDARIKRLTIDKNIGASFGRNTGLKAVTGEYIAFVDDDDRCEPEMLAHLAELAKTENADIAMCGSYNDFGDRLEPYFIHDERIVLNRLDGLRELLKRKLYNVAPPTKLFRRELWEDLTYPDNVLVDDIHIVYKAFERAQTVAVWNKPLYYFRKHATNMTTFIHNTQMTPALLDEYLAMYETRAQYLIERAPEIESDVDASMISFMENMCRNILDNNLSDCNEQLAFMKNHLTERGVVG